VSQFDETNRIGESTRWTSARASLSKKEHPRMMPFVCCPLSAVDSQIWRQKYEEEGLDMSEESESAKMKLQSRVGEGQGCVKQPQWKGDVLGEDTLRTWLA
jgi:hypothetical protein